MYLKRFGTMIYLAVIYMTVLILRHDVNEKYIDTVLQYEYSIINWFL